MARVLLVLALVALASAVPADLRGDDAGESGSNTRYDPDVDTEYHLFTLENPTVSQRIIEGNANLLYASNFGQSRKTIIVIHGEKGSVVSDVNTVLVPAFLYAGNVNVIVVDWSKGANWGLNGIDFVPAIARVLQWIATESGAKLSNFHIVGFNDGAHMAGLIGRQLSGEIGHITGLEPSYSWFFPDTLRASDSMYTEVIVTNSGEFSTPWPNGHVIFVPNGGVEQPGCATNMCSHNRSFFFLAESLRSGGFIGRACDSFQQALDHKCTGERKLEMGGLWPKTGESGTFYLTTNALPPFARGDIN